MQDATPAATASASVEDELDAGTAAGTAIRGSALRSAAYAAGVVLSLITAPLVVRHLGVDDFGVYVTITALVTIVAGMSDLGLTSLGVREWAQRDGADRHALMRDLLGARLAFTAVGIAAAFAFAFAAGYDTQRLAGTAVASLALMIQGVQAALTVPLAGRLRQGWIGAADIVRQLVQTITVLVLLLFGAGLVPLLAAAVPAALAGLTFTAVAARDGLVLPAIHPRRWAHLLRGTIPFAAASGVSVVYLRTTVVLTSLVATASQNGQFAIAFRVMEVLINVPALLVGALFPLFARAAMSDHARLRASLERTWQATLAMGALITVSVVAAAPIAVLVIAGERPAGAVDALRILGFALGCSFLGAACQYGLLALREHRSILAINLIALTINASLTLLLAPGHGAVGAATALGCSELFVAVWATHLLRRAMGGLHVGGRLAVRVGIVLACGLALAAALTPVSFFVAGVIAPTAALALAILLGVIPADLLTALRPKVRLT